MFGSNSASAGQLAATSSPVTTNSSTTTSSIPRFVFLPQAVIPHQQPSSIVASSLASASLIPNSVSDTSHAPNRKASLNSNQLKFGMNCMGSGNNNNDGCNKAANSSDCKDWHNSSNDNDRHKPTRSNISGYCSITTKRNLLNNCGVGNNNNNNNSPSLAANRHVTAGIQHGQQQPTSKFSELSSQLANRYCDTARVSFLPQSTNIAVSNSLSVHNVHAADHWNRVKSVPISRINGSDPVGICNIKPNIRQQNQYQHQQQTKSPNKRHNTSESSFTNLPVSSTTSAYTINDSQQQSAKFHSKSISFQSNLDHYHQANNKGSIMPLPVSKMKLNKSQSLRFDTTSTNTNNINNSNTPTTNSNHHSPLCTNSSCKSKQIFNMGIQDSHHKIHPPPPHKPQYKHKNKPKYTSVCMACS